jgi:hypothetical protein
MLYCEDCRLLKRFNRPSTFPYHRHGVNECELCKKRKDCYDYPAIWAKQRSDWDSAEIILDKRLQDEYHQKAEGLLITYVRGKHAGGIDVKTTEWLKDAIIRTRTGEIDWYGTYELRVRLQEGYYKIEHRKGETNV